MGKKSNDLSKTLRLMTVQRVVARWGRLTPAQIAEHVASALAVDVNDVFKRNIYRDLEDLHEMGLVRDVRQGRDGSDIESYDPEVHKNAVVSWVWVGSEGRVIGDTYLRDHGGSFQCSKRISKEVKIETGTFDSDYRTSHVYFSVEQSFLCLKISHDAIPVCLVVGRPLNSPNYLPPFAEVEKKFGSRTALLLTPSATLSGCKDAEKPGHFKITFNSTDHCNIEDLNSKNGTSIYKLTPSLADAYRRSAELSGDETLSKSWNRVEIGTSLEPILLASGKSMDCPLPFLVEVSESCRFLVM